MLQTLWLNSVAYLSSLQTLGWHYWHTMSPSDYGGVLVGVGFFGWVLMKSASRR